MKLKNLFNQLGIAMGFHAVISPYNTDEPHKKIFLSNQLEKKAFLGENTIWSIDKRNAKYRIRTVDRYWIAKGGRIGLRNGGKRMRALDNRENRNILISILGENSGIFINPIDRRAVNTRMDNNSNIEIYDEYDEEEEDPRAGQRVGAQNQGGNGNNSNPIRNPDEGESYSESLEEDDGKSIRYPIVDKAEEQGARRSTLSSLLSQLESVIGQLRGKTDNSEHLTTPKDSDNVTKSNSRDDNNTNPSGNPQSESSEDTQGGQNETQFGTTVKQIAYSSDRPKKRRRGSSMKFLDRLRGRGSTRAGFDFEFVPIFKNDVDKATVIFSIPARGCVNNRLKIIKCDINNLYSLHSSKDDIFWEVLPMENPKFLKAMKTYLSNEVKKVTEIESQAICYQNMKTECERICPKPKSICRPANSCCPRARVTPRPIPPPLPPAKPGCNPPSDILSLQPPLSGCTPVRDQNVCPPRNINRPVTHPIPTGCGNYDDQVGMPLLQSSDSALQNNPELYQGILNSLSPVAYMPYSGPMIQSTNPLISAY